MTRQKGLARCRSAIQSGALVRSSLRQECFAMSARTDHPLEIAQKLQLLLRALRAVDFGPARIVNLVDGLNAKHINSEHIRALLDQLPDPSPDPKEFHEATVNVLAQLSNDIFFKRPSPPDCELPFALVLPLRIFNEVGGFHILSDAYIRGKRPSKSIPDPMEASEPDGLLDLLDYVREGLSRHLARGLGGAPGRVVFVTPVDQFWIQLTAGRFLRRDSQFTDPGPADLVCDYLGLGYRNDWLLELRSRVPLRELIARDQLMLAAPTVIEAWVHDYFRHWPRGTEEDRWGRTLHLGENFTDRRGSEGRPEAILNKLSQNLLSTQFDVSILGRVTARPRPPPEAVCSYLIESRELAALVQEAVMTVAGATP